MITSADPRIRFRRAHGSSRCAQPRRGGPSNIEPVAAPTVVNSRAAVGATCASICLAQELSAPLVSYTYVDRPRPWESLTTSVAWTTRCARGSVHLTHALAVAVRAWWCSAREAGASAAVCRAMSFAGRIARSSSPAALRRSPPEPPQPWRPRQTPDRPHRDCDLSLGCPERTALSDGYPVGRGSVLLPIGPKTLRGHDYWRTP